MTQRTTSLKPGEEVRFKEEPIPGKGTLFTYDGYFDFDSERLYIIKTGIFSYNVKEDDFFRCLRVI